MPTRNLRVLCSFLFVVSAVSAADGYRNFKVAVYARSYEVRQMKDPAWLEARWSVIEKEIHVDKVYVETFRDDVIPDEETLAAVKAFFAKRGVKTSGGIAAVRNERDHFRTFCYSDPEERQKLKQVVEYTARHFDEIILDDFFFTSCVRDSEIQAKGSRSWTEYRLALMAEVARDVVIGPARAVNPKVRLVIKYPNWYDHYQFSGYNLEVEPKLFDGIYTGTETRDPVYNDQHLQQYEGYEIVRYLENVKPGGNGGGWVDPPNRQYLDRYAEQIWLTLFAKAPEITLFDFRQLIDPVRGPDGAPVPDTLTGRVAGYTFEQVDGYLGALGKPVGVKSYKPFHSSGEDFLVNYLGMLGIPVELTPVFPADAPVVLLTEQAKFDPEIVGRIKGQLVAGKNVVITSGLLRALQGKGIEDIVEVEYTGRKAVTHEFGSRGQFRNAESDIIIPEIRYPTNDAWETISCLSSGVGYPILLEAAYSKGTLYMLTIPDSFGDLYKLPTDTLTRIKEVLAKDVFVRVEAPAQVSLFAYDNNSFIVESFLPHVEQARLVLDRRFAAIRDLTTGQRFEGQAEGDRMVYRTFLQPHTYRVFVAEAGR
ncbi:MAG: hypothetical protein ABSF98_30315 [Bryobacteraceae bacterium]|jgi:hypothetical protein